MSVAKFGFEYGNTSAVGPRGLPGVRGIQGAQGAVGVSSGGLVLNDINDVDVSGAVANNVLTYDGTGWGTSDNLVVNGTADMDGTLNINGHFYFNVNKKAYSWLIADSDGYAFWGERPQAGVETYSGSIIHGTRDYLAFNFKETYSSPPHMVASLRGLLPSHQSGIYVTVYGITTTGASVCIYNDSGSTITNPEIQWIALHNN